MKKFLVFLTILLFFFRALGISYAELIDRGGGLIYDTSLDITWLQDADYIGTIGAGPNDISWDDAITLVDELEYYDSVRDVVWDDWRLPTALNQDGTGPCYGYGCTDSEMGYLYYIELGNQDELTNPGPFIIFNDVYWTSTGSGCPSDPDWAWWFFFSGGEPNGFQGCAAKVSWYGAWPVRDGDVGPPVLEISVDIMPRTCPNATTKKGGGSLTVAILGSADLDVADIDIASVRLEEEVAPVRSRIKDVSTPVSNPIDECDCTTAGSDGFSDLVLKFGKKEVLDALGGVSVGDEPVITLTGVLTDTNETPIEGTDCIVIIKNKGKK